ncbi:MAG: Uma2 family endonuclease [Lachnospiraceae bacterium]|nr:Uma2 family endonuclease [Lachnospiraceae bacterium]
MRKLLKYEAAGVREYWIVDPDKERVMVYDFKRETTMEYSFGEEIPVAIYEGFTIKME